MYMYTYIYIYTLSLCLCQQFCDACHLHDTPVYFWMMFNLYC